MPPPKSGCEPFKEERDVLEGEIRDVDEGGEKVFDALDGTDKKTAVLGEK